MNKSDQVIEISDCLLQGDIVLLPTDTVYGLAVLPSCAESVARLYHLKDRPTNMRLPIMVASMEQLEALGMDITPAVKHLLASSWIPGPLTIVMGFVDRPTVSWLQGRVEVAIRIPNDDFLLSVLKTVGPLYVTSANRHGTPTPGRVSDILLQLNGKPDKTVDGGERNEVPSTIINCRFNPPVIERIGIIPRVEIEQYITG